MSDHRSLPLTDLSEDEKQARLLLDEAFARMRKTDAGYCEGELLCIDGELRLGLRRPDRTGAEASFLRAIEIAHRQGAKAVQLRAAIHIARLWSADGKRREARDLLVGVHGWFNEGFATEPLMEAKGLIESLA